MREIRTLRAMWRALETGFSLKIYAPALDPTAIIRPFFFLLTFGMRDLILFFVHIPGPAVDLAFPPSCGS